MNNSKCPNKLDYLDEWTTLNLNLNWHYYWADVDKWYNPEIEYTAP